MGYTLDILTFTYGQFRWKKVNIYSSTVLNASMIVAPVDKSDSVIKIVIWLAHAFFGWKGVKERLSKLMN